MLLTYSVGLKLGEVVPPCCEDIDVDRRMIHVRQEKQRKNRYTRLSDVALEMLEEYMARYRSKTWLFPGAGYRPASARTIRPKDVPAGAEEGPDR